MADVLFPRTNFIKLVGAGCLIVSVLVESGYAQTNKEKLVAERDAVWKQAQNAVGEFDHAAAVKFARQALALEAQAFGKDNEASLNTLTTLSSQVLFSGDVASARKFAEELQRMRLKLRPKDWWCDVDTFRVQWLSIIGNAPAKIQQTICRQEAEYTKLRALNDHAKTLKSLQKLAKLEVSLLGKDNAFYGNTHSNEGGLYVLLKKDAEAVASFQKAIDNFKKNYGVDHPITAFNLRDQAKALARLKKTSESIAAYRAALVAFEKHQLKSDQASVHQQLGHGYKSTGKSELAVENYLLAAKQYDELGFSYSRAFALSAAGSVLRDQKKHAEAANRLVQAADLFVKNEKPGFAGSDYSAAARSLFAIKSYKQSIPVFEKASRYYLEDGNFSGAGWMFNWLGDAQRQLDQYKQAASSYGNSLKQFRSIKNDAGIAASAFELGKAQKHEGEFRDAAKSFLEARDAFTRNDKPKDAAWMCNWAGDCMVYSSQTKDAVAAYADGLKRFQKLKYNDGIAESAFECAEKRRQDKQYEAAITDLKTAQQAYVSLNNRNAVTRCVVQIWVCCDLLEEFDKPKTQTRAAAAFETALARLSEHRLLKDLDLHDSEWTAISRECRALAETASRTGHPEKLPPLIKVLARLWPINRGREFQFLCELAEQQLRAGHQANGESCLAAVQNIPRGRTIKESERLALLRASAFHPSTADTAIGDFRVRAIRDLDRKDFERAAERLLFVAEATAHNGQNPAGYVDMAFSCYAKQINGKAVSVDQRRTIAAALKRTMFLPNASMGSVPDNLLAVLKNEMDDLLADAAPTDKWHGQLFAARSFRGSNAYAKDAKTLYAAVLNSARATNNLTVVKEALNVQRLLAWQEKDFAAFARRSSEIATSNLTSGDFHDSFCAAVDSARAWQLAGSQQNATRGFESAINAARKFGTSKRVLRDENSLLPSQWWQFRGAALRKAFANAGAGPLIDALANAEPLATVQGFAEWTNADPLRQRRATWRLNGTKPGNGSTSFEFLVQLVEQTEFYTPTGKAVDRDNANADSNEQPTVTIGNLTLSRSRDLARWLESSPTSLKSWSEFSSAAASDIVIQGTLLPRGLQKTAFQQTLSDRKSTASVVLQSAEFSVRLRDKSLIPSLTLRCSTEKDARAIDAMLPEFRKAIAAEYVGQMQDSVQQFPGGKERIEKLTDMISEWCLSAKSKRDGKSLILSLPTITQQDVRRIVGQMDAARQLAVERMQRFQETTNIRQVLLGLHSHHSRSRKMPDAWSVDSQGNRLLSWRVHLLPQLGDEAAALYKRFKLNEPWDSPHNKSLIAEIPAVYQAKSPDVSKGKTCLQFVTSDNAAWNKQGQWQAADRFQKDLILLITTSAERAVTWTQPQDYSFEPGEPAAGLKADDPEGVLVGLSTGASRDLNASANPKWIEYLFSAKREKWSGDDPTEPMLAFADEQEDRDMQKRAPAKQDLQEIAMALQFFSGNAAHKTLGIKRFDPLPQYSVSQSGKPLLSWRVHLLPQLDQRELYEQFHLDEPWDSPHNKSLLSKMPEVYRHPDSAASATTTRYLLATGPGTYYASRIPQSDLVRAAKDTTRVILGVSVPKENAVPWTKPEDLPDVTPGMLIQFAGDGELDCMLDDREVVQFTSKSDRDFIQQWLTPELEPVSIQQKLHVVSQALTSHLKDIHSAKRSKQKAETPPPNEQLSWRVHILPLIGEDKLYREFHLDEPWSSAHNKALIPRMPSLYDPFGEAGDRGKTPIRRFTGRGTAASGITRLEFYRVNSQAAQLGLFRTDEEVVWTKPSSVRVDAESKSNAINKHALRTILRGEFFHPFMLNSDDVQQFPESGYAVSFLDRSQPFLLSRAIPDNLWRAILSGTTRNLDMLSLMRYNNHAAQSNANLPPNRILVTEEVVRRTKAAAK